MPLLRLSRSIQEQRYARDGIVEDRHQSSCLDLYVGELMATFKEFITLKCVSLKEKTLQILTQTKI